MRMTERKMMLIRFRFFAEMMARIGRTTRKSDATFQVQILAGAISTTSEASGKLRI